MITAKSVKPSVGVAPGTTTFVLGDAGCANADMLPGRVAYQKQLLNPPGKFAPFTVSPVPPDGAASAAPPRRWWRRRRPAAAPASISPSDPSRTATVVGRLNPYQDLARLKGSGLGFVLQTGTPPNPYEVTYVGQNTRCYQGSYDKQFHTRGEPGYYYDTPLGNGLGATPTDRQLAPYFGYTPFMTGSIPLRQPDGRTAHWPSPWIPPRGYIGPPRLRPTDLGDAAETAAAALVPRPVVPESQRVADELVKHQRRVFTLSLLSTAAVVSTAVFNLVRNRRDHRDRYRDRDHRETSQQQLPVI